MAKNMRTLNKDIHFTYVVVLFHKSVVIRINTDKADLLFVVAYFNKFPCVTGGLVFLH